MKELEGKTVLVTGATGLIGSHLTQVLLQRGASVVALSRSEQKLKKAFAREWNTDKFDWIAQDISMPLQLQRPIDYIFHAAGPMEGKIIANTPLAVIEPNLNGTIQCLEYLRRQERETGLKGRMILFSSVTVYGNDTSEDHTVTEEDTNVTDFLESKSAPYSQSKRMSEVIAQAYVHQHGQDVVIARLSTVYGDTIFRPDTAFFEFMRKASAGEEILLNSSGIGRRDNIYINDATEALLCIALKGKCGEAYNVSSNGEAGNYVAVDEIAEKIVRLAREEYGSKATVTYKEGKTEKRRPGLKLSNEKLKKLGWSLNCSMEQGLRETLSEFYMTKE